MNVKNLVILAIFFVIVDVNGCNVDNPLPEQLTLSFVVLSLIALLLISMWGFIVTKRKQNVVKSKSTSRIQDQYGKEKNIQESEIATISISHATKQVTQANINSDITSMSGIPSDDIAITNITDVDDSCVNDIDSSDDNNCNVTSKKFVKRWMKATYRKKNCFCLYWNE